MRVLNRIAAMLLALALFAGGLLLAVEAALVWLRRPPLLVPRDAWYRALRESTAADTAVLIAAIAALAVGVAVLVVQLWPWRPVRLPADRPGWYLRRRSAQRSLAAAVSRLPAVSAVTARLGRGWRVRVRAAADAVDRDTVRQAALTELERLAAADSSRLRVRLSRRRVV